MLARFQKARQEYPGQFWLMFWGLLFSTSGSSMVWPFLLIYLGKKLELPDKVTASLFTINAACAIFSSFLAGPLTDKLGRKGVMTISLLADASLFMLMIPAKSYWAFAIILALRGISQPLYRVGADAMMADLIPPEKRLDAYALLRMVTNAGISIGPVAGGLLSSTSYSLAFFCAGIGLGIYGLLLLFFARETLPAIPETQPTPTKERWGGYNRILADKQLISVVGTIAFGWITASLMWVVLPKYANSIFGVPEKLYGWIPATNALMVVFFQVLVSRIVRRYPPLRMMALGMFIYTLSNLGVAFAQSFWGFWACMVWMTIGELTIVPTSNTYVANLAPPDMRGRYMSLYGLTWPFGTGVGPLLGGVLSDSFGPRATWFGGAAIGLLATLSLLAMSGRGSQPQGLAGQAKASP
jgi:MFS family permease